MTAPHAALPALGLGFGRHADMMYRGGVLLPRFHGVGELRERVKVIVGHRVF